MHIKDPDAAASAGADTTAKHARKADVTDQTEHGAKSPAVTDEAKADLPPELQAFFQAAAGLITFDYTPEQWREIAKSIQHFLAKPEAYEKALLKLLNSARSFYLETLNKPGRKREEKWRLNHWTKVGKLADTLMSELLWLARNEPHPPDPSGKERKRRFNDELDALITISVMAKKHVVGLGGLIDDGFPKTTTKMVYHSSVLVSVRRVLESSESVVIQGRWPDSTRGSPDVDERKPRAL